MIELWTFLWFFEPAFDDYRWEFVHFKELWMNFVCDKVGVRKAPPRSQKSPFVWQVFRKRTHLEIEIGSHTKTELFRLQEVNTAGFLDRLRQ